MGDPVHAAAGTGSFDAYWIQADLREPGSSTANPDLGVGTSRSADGRTWDAPNLVANLTGDSPTAPFLTDLQAYALPAGSACLFLRTSAVLSRVVHVQRMSASTTTTVLASSAQPVAYSALAGCANGSGQQAACWIEAPGNLVFRVLPLNASSWSAPIVAASPGNSGNPSLAMDANGRLLLAWLEVGAIKARLYDVAAGVLGPIVTLNASLSGAASSLAVSAFGDEFAVAWRQAGGFVNEIYAARTGGSSWTVPQLLDSTTVLDNLFGVRLFAMPSGGVLALWERPYGVMASAFANGSWSGAARVVPAPVGFLLQKFNAAVRQNGETIIGCLAAASSNTALRAYIGVRLTNGSVTPSTALTDAVEVPLLVSAPRISSINTGAALITWYQSFGTPTALGATNVARTIGA
jgi:hypothetical protein